MFRVGLKIRPILTLGFPIMNNIVSITTHNFILRENLGKQTNDKKKEKK